MCAVEHMGNDGLKEICTVEEIKRIRICVESGTAASVWQNEILKNYTTKNTEKTGTKSETVGKHGPDPPIDNGQQHTRREHAGDQRAGCGCE